MLKLDLTAMTRRKTNRRQVILPDIATTKAQADALALLYLKAIEAWASGAGRIVESYERTISQMITDSPAETAGTVESVDAAIRRLVLLLTPDLRNWAFRVEEVHRGKWLRNVFSATSIDLSTILSPGDMNETVELVVNWNVALIRDVSDEIRRKVSNLVFSGFQQRQPAREIAKGIRETTGMARKRSLRIAADQTVKLGSRLNEARQRQAGLDHFKWRHSGKVHPRSWHKDRDGKVYRWEDPGIPADDMPGVPPYCGCTAQGVVVLDE